MGGCCGKGAAPKDPDKTPYSPSKKPERVEKENLKAPLNTGDIPRAKTNNEKVSPKELEASTENGATPEIDTDSFVVIELDTESKPRVIEPTKVAKTDNTTAVVKALTPQQTQATVPVDHPSKRPIKDRISPIAVPKQSPPKELIFSPRAVDAETKIPELVVTPTKQDAPKRSSITPPKTYSATKVGDGSTQAPGIKRQEAIAISPDDSSTSSFDDSIVATPDVVLRIEEPERDTPADKKSPPASPAKKSAIARPTLDAPKSRLSEEIPDPKTIIENVRNKAKSGDYIKESSPITKESRSSISSSVTSTTTTVVKTVSEGLDANKNKSDSVAVSALKQPGVKEEIVTRTEVTVEKSNFTRDSPVRVSKLPSLTGVSTQLKKQETPEPLSPKYESTRSGLKMPSVVGVRKSLEKDDIPKSPEPPSNKAKVLPGATKEEVKLPLKDTQDVPVIKVKTEANTSTVLKNGLDTSPIDKIEKASNDTVKDETPCKSTDSSHDNLNVNGIAATTRPDTETVVLPDFTQSNSAVVKRHCYCTNTRMQALTSIDKWLKDSSADKSRVMVVKADPGMGKTTLLTEVCSKYEDTTAGYHYFNYTSYDLNHNDVKYALLWLVKSFAKTIDSFAGTLPQLNDIEELVNSGSIDDVTQKLIVNPLKSEALQHDPNHNMLVVIDALDECHIADRHKLFEFVDNFSSNTPSWLHLCVSFRIDNQLDNLLTTSDVVEIKNNNENMLDIKRMMKESLGHFMDRISLDGGLTQLAKKTHGLPLCAALYNRILDSMDRSSKVALREIDIKFATSIDGVLSNVLNSFKKSIDSEKSYEQKYANLIGMLALARQPINQTFIAKAGFKDVGLILDQLKVVLVSSDNDIVILHKVIAEWLLDQHKGGDLGVDINTAKNNVATYCSTWLEPLIGESTPIVPATLIEYAVKHAVAHLVDKPKEQESVGKVLCSLHVIQQKMELGGVDSVMRDYRHEHEQIDHSHKRVSLQEYMKKVPKLEEQVKIYKSFLKDNYIHLKNTPSSLYQLAANYTKAQRIQQNARIEVTSLHWLEDLTAVPETHCTSKSFIGTIMCADLSPDGKTIAFVTTDKEDVHLHQYHTQTLEPKVPFIDITGLNGRTNAKACCKYLPDGLHIFVGSLENFINNKGKSVPTGYDVASTQLREKVAVESCCVSTKYIATSLTSFPFNGRSVHLSVFGLKDKKALKTIEVLKFRFGGNAQFGVKGCSISPDEKLLGACIKQNNKHEIKINVWGVGKWSILHTIDLASEHVHQCAFGEMTTLLLNIEDSKSNKCLAWKPASGEDPVMISDEGSLCTLGVSKSHIAVCCRNQNTGNAKLKKWKKTQPIQQEPSSTFKINGLGTVKCLLLMHSNLVVCEEQTLKVFDPSDLEDVGDDNAGSLQVCDMNVESFAFMPRSDTVVAAAKSQQTASVYTCENFGEDLQVTNSPLTGSVIGCGNKSSNVFHGKALSSQRGFVSNDGSSYILNLENQILLWSTSNDQVEHLSLPADVGSDAEITLCLPSPKESIIAVVYSQNPHVVYLHDLKTKQAQRQLRLEHMTVCDLAFMPSNGYLLTHHRGDSSKLAIWNQRTAKHVSVESVDVAFVKVSQSSDRLVLSKNDSGVGQLLLRSSDSKVCAVLDTDKSWSCSIDQCDAEFSPDGTVLVGVDSKNNFCRIWNAGNGDVLKHMHVQYRQSPFIVGMPTNTHVAICDSRISILDIASGESLCVAPITCAYDRSQCKLNVSPRGNIIAGTSTNGRAVVYRLHNFAAIKMKTTLQRMKSFSA